jgi:hypothetical protein
MALNRKFITELYPAKREPIEYLTENDFRIIRRCDVDDSFPKDGLEHCFIVRDPDGYELDITVTFDTRAAAEVIERSRRRITFESSFWVTAAERHLAEYLWEHNDWPADGNLRIEQLTLDDIDMAVRWNVEKNESSIYLP